MARYESSEPVEVVDRLLWRDAQQMLSRHAEPDVDDRCTWCGDPWPCPPRRLAERAETAARQPWRDSWPTRHDLNSLCNAPNRRSAPARPLEHGRRFNGGLFD